MRLPASVVIQGHTQFILVGNALTASNHFKNLPGKSHVILTMKPQFNQKGLSMFITYKKKTQFRTY